jgi:hypothetical protein
MPVSGVFVLLRDTLCESLHRPRTFSIMPFFFASVSSPSRTFLQIMNISTSDREYRRDLLLHILDRCLCNTLCLRRPFLINLSPALNLPILTLNSRPRPYILLRMLRNCLSRPRDLDIWNRRLVTSDYTSTLCDELILRGGVVDMCECFFIWAERFGGFGSAAAEKVAADEREI